MWSKKDLIEKQARFWLVIASGSTLQAACDAVGVDRRTGRRWRQATGGQVPRKKPEPSGRYLSVEERLQIADLRLAGAGVRTIATQIGRAPSTVSRELHRNGPRRACGHETGTHRMRPRSEPSYALAGPRPPSSTTPNWHPWYRRSCASSGAPSRSATTWPRCCRPAGDAGESRDDLPGPVCAGSRSSAR